MDISVTTETGKTRVQSPFHPKWPDEAKRIGGQWSGGALVFDARDEARVCELAIEIYGSAEFTDTVSVRIQVGDAQGDRDGRPPRTGTAGRFATRFGRDSEPRPGDSVILISGGFAGSHNYITLGPLVGTLVEVRDMSRQVAEDQNLEIVNEGGPHQEALRAEPERLLARNAEINTSLGR
ncbi:hypothetical protein ACFWN1_24430 [Streptomyces sp. NPDC058459]|uniref:hypothetical protein n=1 Tax=Streptomyces sp. NPDC058459 TaxID=3346508 RepID=UPI00364F809C